MTRTQAWALAALAVLLVGGGLSLLLPGWLDPYRLPPRDWALFKKNFLSPDGRIIDTGNDNISHSEGQGYGLLISVAYRDKTAFERIWTWTQKNLQTRPHDRLLSWKWIPDEKGGGAVADPNNASDGDLIVAWALLRAYKLWGNYQHQQSALQILADLAKLDIVHTESGPLLLPGTDGFAKDDGITVNPSYYVFPALAEFSAFLPGSPWQELHEAGLELIRRARFGKWQLTPDWILEGKKIELSPNFPPLFGYNAIRVPLNVGWIHRNSPLMQPFAKFWKPLGKKPIPATVNLQTGEFGPHPALPGMKAIVSFTLACAGKQKLTVKALPALTKEESYYSASLNLLTKMAIRESFAQTH